MTFLSRILPTRNRRPAIPSCLFEQTLLTTGATDLTNINGGNPNLTNQQTGESCEAKMPQWQKKQSLQVETL